MVSTILHIYDAQDNDIALGTIFSCSWEGSMWNLPKTQRRKEKYWTGNGGNQFLGPDIIMTPNEIILCMLTANGQTE